MEVDDSPHAREGDQEKGLHVDTRFLLKQTNHSAKKHRSTGQLFFWRHCSVNQHSAATLRPQSAHCCLMIHTARCRR